MPESMAKIQTSLNAKGSYREGGGRSFHESTDVFTTSDSNVVFTTANAFNVQIDWLADNGGAKPKSYIL